MQNKNPNILHVENIWICYTVKNVKMMVKGDFMDNAMFEWRWPTDNLKIDMCVHELSRYSFHWHEAEYEIDILLKGRGEFCCEGSIYSLEEDDIIVVNCGDGHGSLALEPGTVAVVLRFSDQFFKKLTGAENKFKFHCISRAETRNHPSFRKMRYFILQILEAAMQDHSYAQLTIDGSMRLLISTLCSFFPPVSVPSIEPKDEYRQKSIRSIVRYVEKHYSQKITLDALARITKYNRTYVSTFFKENVGMNFYEYLTRVRFASALQELDNMEKNLTEVAIDNGFPDLKTFNYRFQKIFHMYPSEYRRAAAEIAPRKNFNQRRYCTMDNEILQNKMSQYLGLN